MNRFGLKALFLSLLLFGSWFFPPTRSIWDKLDLCVFKFLNGTLEGHPTWQYFWAFANGHTMDWIHDIVMLLFFGIYVGIGKKEERLKRSVELFLCILIIFINFICINKFLFTTLIEIPRQGPSLVVENSFLLSKHVNLSNVKDRTLCSFPGDHGTTALLFMSFMFLLGGIRFGIPAALYALFFCLPRMISGAHWLTDNLIGSGSIALFALSLTFGTSLFKSLRDKMMNLLKRRKHEESQEPLR